MKVKELMAMLEKYDGNTEVMTKKTNYCGNIGSIHSVREDSYGFFGKSISCIILSDEWEDDEEDEGDE